MVGSGLAAIGTYHLLHGTMTQKSVGDILTHPLWIMPVLMIGIFAFIEGIHTMAHLRMNMDVHGYCMQNKEHIERMEQDDDDW